MKGQDSSARKLYEIESYDTLAILSAIVEGTTDSIYVKDKAGRYIMINSPGAGWFGKSVADVIGKTDNELFPSETAQTFIESDRKIFDTGKTETSVAHVKMNGSQITLQTVKAPYKDAHGNVIGIIGISRSISDIEESKRAAEKSYSLVRATLESTADGILVVDNQKNITGYNQNFVDLWRISKEKLDHHGYSWALQFVLDQLNHPDICVKRLDEIFAHPDQESYDSLEFKDGRVFERYSRPQRLGEQIIGRVFSYRDVTARVKSERALKESEDRLARFLDKLPIGVIVFDNKGKLHYGNENASQILGRKISPGITIKEFQAANYAFIEGTDEPYPETRMPSSRALQGESLASSDDMELRIDHTRKNLQLWASPVYNSRDELDFAVIAFRDITLEKIQRAERERYLSLLQTTLDATTDGILVVDSEGRTVIHNRNFVEIWNLPQEMIECYEDAKMIDWVKNQLKSPEDFTKKVEELYQHPEKESYDTLEFKSGRVLERYSSPHRLGNKIVGRVWSFRDVTARIRAEKSLRESEARKAAILASAIDSIITMDRNGNVVEMNPAAERTFGYAVPYAVGRPLSNLIIPPRFREAHSAGLAHYLQTGESLLLGRSTELIAMRADGTELPVEVSIVQTRSTDQLVFTGFVRDITERKKNEKLIRKGAEQIQALVETSRDLIASRLDLDKILDATVKRVAEYFHDGCVVRLFSEDGMRLNTVAFSHVDPIAESYLKPLLEQAHGFIDKHASAEILASGKPISVSGPLDEIRARLSPEHAEVLDRYPVHSWVIVPLRLTDKLIGTVTVFRYRPGPGYAMDEQIWLQEVADRAALSIGNAALYRDATRAIQLREDFMSIASHELKTPLTPLKMQLQLLSHLVQTGVAVAGPLEEKLKSVISASDQQIARLTRLVDDILDATRMRTGRFVLKREPVELDALISNVIQRMNETDVAAKRQIEFYPEQIKPASWDRLRIEQVVTNLLTNALKFGRGKPIIVRMGTRDDRAMFSVQDFGIGIAKENHERVFERLERAVSLKQYGGLGMGLYIARQIVELHGGQILLDSQEGLGSTFTVELPFDFKDGA